MGSIDGVKTVAFDCKIATVTMTKDATLTREAAEAALKKESFGVTSFKGGPAPTQTVYVFRIEGAKASARDDVRKSLAAGLSEANEVVVDSTGSALVVMKDGATLEPARIGELLGARGCTVQAFETKSWPVGAVTYRIGVSGLEGDTAMTASAAVRDRLARLEKVLAAHVFQDSGTVVIRLNEPCDRIEAAVNEALAGSGHTVTRFERMGSGTPEKTG